MEAGGVTINDSEVVCTGHSEWKFRRIEGIERRKRAARKKMSSLELDNGRLGSECTQLLATTILS